MALVSSGPSADAAWDLALDGAGRVVLGGFTGTPTGRAVTVVRLDPDGIPDASFGTDGVATARFGVGGVTDGISAVAVDGDRIVTADVAGGRLAVARFVGYDDPVLTASPGPAVFTEHGPAVPVDPGLTLTADLRLAGATVAIDGTVAAQDVLTFTPAGNVTGTFDPTSGVLTLAGADTAAVYQQVLRSVAYQNTAPAPDARPRTIRVVAQTGVPRTPGRRPPAGR